MMRRLCLLTALRVSCTTGSTCFSDVQDESALIQTSVQLNTKTFQPKDKAQTGLETDTVGTCHGAWPLFHNSEQLTGSPWGTYFTRIYGEIPQKGYPICLGNFRTFYQDELKHAGVELPESMKGCPSSAKNSGHWTTGVSEPVWMAVRIYHFEKKPLPAQTWIEVTHRARTMQSGFERHGAWFGYTPGSGFWTNTGKTIHFDTHPEAFKHFGAKWEIDLAQKAALKGFDTVQFLKGDGVSEDSCCKKLDLGACCDSLEFVKTKLTGTYGCAEPAGGDHIRAGWLASRACHCDEKAALGTTMLNTFVSYMNCKGVGILVEPKVKPKGAKQADASDLDDDDEKAQEIKIEIATNSLGHGIWR